MASDERHFERGIAQGKDEAVCSAHHSLVRGVTAVPGGTGARPADVRAGTSVGAHYREASRSRSDAEFISKIEGGLQELEETAYWLELLIESTFGPPDEINELLDEANQLTRMLVASVRTVKRRLGRI